MRSTGSRAARPGNPHTHTLKARRRCRRVPKLRIRRATLRDLGVLVEHRRRMFVDMGDLDPASPRAKAADRRYRAWARAKLRQRARFAAFVAERDGQVVGSGCVWVMDTQPSPWNPRARTPYLLSIYTHPEARGQGVASLIVKAALAWSKARGHRIMRLHASRQGRGVYRRFGFERSWEMRLDWSGRERHHARRSRAAARPPRAKRSRQAR